MRVMITRYVGQMPQRYLMFRGIITKSLLNGLYTALCNSHFFSAIKILILEGKYRTLHGGVGVFPLARGRLQAVQVH